MASGSAVPTTLKNVITEHIPDVTSKWKTTTAVPFSAEALLDLLEGRTPLLQEPNFIDTELCRKIACEVERGFSPYVHATGPAVEKVGVAQFEYQAQSKDDFLNRTDDAKANYFEAVSKVKNLHTELAARTGINIFERVLEYISSFVPNDWEVCLAREKDFSCEDHAGGGREYFAGVIRGINNGLPIHCDWAPHDTLTEDWIIQRVTHQAVFNLYLSQVDGGETTVHDVQWTPAAMAFRDPTSYGYLEALVERRKKVSFHPNAGDLYIFNSRNMHQVEAVAQECGTRRVTMASFFGVLPPQGDKESTKLIFWA